MDKWRKRRHYHYPLNMAIPHGYVYQRVSDGWFASKITTLGLLIGDHHPTRYSWKSHTNHQPEYHFVRKIWENDDEPVALGFPQFWTMLHSIPQFLGLPLGYPWKSPQWFLTCSLCRPFLTGPHCAGRCATTEEALDHCPRPCDPRTWRYTTEIHRNRQQFDATEICWSSSHRVDRWSHLTVRQSSARLPVGCWAVDVHFSHTTVHKDLFPNRSARSLSESQVDTWQSHG